MRDPTEAELLRRCRCGDAPAWRDLVFAHHEALLNTAYRITLNREDAEDCLQEAWLYIVKALPQFREGSGFRTWATTIVTRQAIKKVQARRSAPAAPLDESRGPATPDPTPAHLEKREILHALSLLDPRERAAVYLHFVEGRSFKEVGECLEMPVRTAADAAYRGLDQIRRSMKVFPHRGREAR